MQRVIILLGSAIFAAGGCTQFDDARLEGRLRRMARSAYVVSPGACTGVVHDVDYSQGFEDGYYDVASGGDGCPPALPPKKYWKATYSSPAGAEHVDAWFQGFRDGAAAAAADGAAVYGTIRVSAEHRNGRPKIEVQPLVLAPTPATPPTPPRGATPSVSDSFPIFGPASPPSPIAPEASAPAKKANPIPKAKSDPSPKSKSAPTIVPRVDASKAPPSRRRRPPPAPMPPKTEPQPKPKKPSPEKPTPIPVRFRESTPNTNTGSTWLSLPKLDRSKLEPAAVAAAEGDDWKPSQR